MSTDHALTPHSHAVRTILFDLAGVLFNLDLEADTRALHAVGLPDFDECLRRPEICRPALDYLNGLMPEAEFLPLIRPYCTPGATDEQILWAMDAVLSDFPVSRMAMLTELRRHYRVILLSNLNERDWRLTLRLIEAAGYTPEQLFDRTFISYQMNLAKPSPLIYQEVIRLTGIRPEETLYLDDTPSNIEAARRLGFRAELIPMNRLEDLWPSFGLLEPSQNAPLSATCD